MSTARNNQLLRVLGMIRDLSAARTGVSIQDLRDRYGVTRRTVERDLAAIEEAGYVVETLMAAEAGKVRKRILAGSGGLNLPITAQELAAARAGVAALERDAPASLVAQLKMLVNRLEESQSMAVAVDADALNEAQAFIPQPGPIPDANAVVMETLRAAILRCERIRVIYRKGGDAPAKVYEAEPYGLLYGAKGYLVWRGVEDRKWRKFALPYIEDVELTNTFFERDSDFVLKDFAEDAFGVCREEPFEIVLKVLPEGMPRLQHHSFHSTQQIEPCEDGCAIVRFTASGLTEICWHLFTWGITIRILAPEALMVIYAEHLQKAVASMRGDVDTHCF